MLTFAVITIALGRIRKVAIGVRPSALLAFHQALVRRQYPRSHASLDGNTPLTFASGPTVARTELNKPRRVSHCQPGPSPVPSGGLATIRDGQAQSPASVSRRTDFTTARASKLSY